MEEKALLKSAKDAIGIKDYKEAIKHLRAALKIDKENYNVCPQFVWSDL